MNVFTKIKSSGGVRKGEGEPSEKLRPDKSDDFFATVRRHQALYSDAFAHWKHESRKWQYRK